MLTCYCPSHQAVPFRPTCNLPGTKVSGKRGVKKKKKKPKIFECIQILNVDNPHSVTFIFCSTAVQFGGFQSTCDDRCSGWTSDVIPVTGRIILYDNYLIRSPTPVFICPPPPPPWFDTTRRGLCLLAPGWSCHRALVKKRCGGFDFMAWLRFAVGFAGEHGGSVTWTITDHWVKMGCCLPGPLNPGITGGNQPVFEKRERYCDARRLNFAHADWSVPPRLGRRVPRPDQNNSPQSPCVTEGRRMTLREHFSKGVFSFFSFFFLPVCTQCTNLEGC